jgi:hypothetical protein
VNEGRPGGFDPQFVVSVAVFIEGVDDDVVGTEAFRFIAKDDEPVGERVDLGVGAEGLAGGVERVIAERLERVGVDGVGLGGLLEGEVRLKMPSGPLGPCWKGWCW